MLAERIGFFFGVVFGIVARIFRAVCAVLVALARLVEYVAPYVAIVGIAIPSTREQGIALGVIVLLLRSVQTNRATKTTVTVGGTVKIPPRPIEEIR